MSAKTLSIPSYTHIINPRLKYIYLSFDDDGQLIVKSPRVSQKEIERILTKRAKWIEDSKVKISQKRDKDLRGDSEDRILFLGEEYPVEYRDTIDQKESVSFDNETGFTIFIHKFDIEKVETMIDYFYFKESYFCLPETIEKYSTIMNLHPTKVGFRRAKRQWGSCSGKNAISLNYLMMKLPLHLIEYVVVHELAHIKHKDHQKGFWQLVERYTPRSKEYKKELKNYRP